MQKLMPAQVLRISNIVTVECSNLKKNYLYYTLYRSANTKEEIEKNIRAGIRRGRWVNIIF